MNFLTSLAFFCLENKLFIIYSQDKVGCHVVSRGPTELCCHQTLIYLPSPWVPLYFVGTCKERENKERGT